MDNWGEDEPPTQLFSAPNLFSDEPPLEGSEVPGGLIFPDLPSLGGVEEVTGLFGAHSVASDGVSNSRRKSSSASSSSAQDTSPVSTETPYPI